MVQTVMDAGGLILFVQCYIKVWRQSCHDKGNLDFVWACLKYIKIVLFIRVYV